MHKLTDAVVEIIKVMASNAYNGMGYKRSLGRSSRVHQVEANSYHSSLKQQMDMLAKQMKIMIKAQE